MKNYALCLAALCLLLVAGCSTPGGSRGRIGGFGRLPAPLGADSRKDSFTEAVENDPFPSAQAGQMRVAVRP